MIHGFDVSAYQGDIVPRADFVFVKATEGASYTSSRFAAQWTSARTNARVRGAYHFARPEQSSAAAQADRFLAVARAVPGELLCLDLEASGLGQAVTNAWAAAFGDRLRERAPGVRTVLYMGSGYATSGTGRGLAQHFDLWWYPQYPSSSATKTWPGSFSPWLPSGLTCGWSRPHIWQWTDNFDGLDANVSTLTIDQLAGGGRPQEESDMIARDVLPGLDAKTQFPIQPGKVTTFAANSDNTYTDGKAVKATAPTKIRVAVRKSDGRWQVEEGIVGRGPKDTTQPEFRFAITDPKSTFVSITRESGDGTEPISVAVY